MIRKMLVVAAAVAMPATALTAVTGTGIAGAAKAPVQSTVCALTGGVDFAAPGYSLDGSLSKKTTVKSQDHVTPTSGACGASADGLSGYASIISKITAPTNLCTNPGTVGVGDAPVCASATSKNKYWYNSTSSFLGSTASIDAIKSSLSKGVKAYNTGNKVTLNADNVAKILPNGVCGASGVGFQLSGSTSVTGLTYSLALCLTTDTGTGTSGTFLTDVLLANAGNTGITVASAGFGGNSALTFTKA